MTFQCLCVERSTELGVLHAELGLGLILEGVYVLSAYWMLKEDGGGVNCDPAFRQLAVQWRIRTAHRNVSAMATLCRGEHEVWGAQDQGLRPRLLRASKL